MRSFCVFLLSCILACLLMACGKEQEISGVNDTISNNATDENDIEDNSDNKTDDEKEDFFAKDHGNVEYIEVHETGGVDGISCYRCLYKYGGKDNDTYVLVFRGGYGSRIEGEVEITEDEYRELTSIDFSQYVTGSGEDNTEEEYSTDEIYYNTEICYDDGMVWETDEYITPLFDKMNDIFCDYYYDN